MGNPRVDGYLTALGQRLGNLTPAQRDEELRELRQHLDALVAGHRARGLDEAAAVDEALRQFGHAEQLGEQLHAARRPARQPRLWPWLVGYLSVVVLLFGAMALANDKPTDFPRDAAGQLLLALVLPAGTLAIGVIDYLRARAASRA